MIARNVAGIAATELTPDLAGFDLAALPGRPAAGAGDRGAPHGRPGRSDHRGRPAAAERVNDGLPETLEEVVARYRDRYYKLKVGGDIKADLERLARIAAVLDRGAGDYRATLDGNEQYDDVEGIVELWRKDRGDAGAGAARRSRRCSSSSRSSARWRCRARSSRWRAEAGDHRRVGRRARRRSRRALKLGYAGVSSKNCKGFYKSILNAARVALKLGDRRYFMSAEDLTTWPASACSRISRWCRCSA